METNKKKTKWHAIKIIIFGGRKDFPVKKKDAIISAQGSEKIMEIFAVWKIDLQSEREIMSYPQGKSHFPFNLQLLLNIIN